MKNYLLLIVLLCLFACKARQVSTVKTTEIDNSVQTDISASNKTKIDTSKTIAQTIVTGTGNNTVEIDIVPDTGTVTITNGNYSGKARNITIKGTAATSQTVKQLVQHNNGNSIKTSFRDSVIQKKDIQIQSKTKQVVAKATNSPWWWLVSLTALIGIGWFVLRQWSKIKAFV